MEERSSSAIVVDHDLLFLSYLSDRALLFTGEPGITGSAQQMQLQEGFNEFLKMVDITFRKDPENARPRANKPGSQKDQEQKRDGTYFYAWNFFEISFIGFSGNSLTNRAIDIPINAPNKTSEK